MLTSLPVIGFLSDGSHGSIAIVRQSLAAAIRARSEQSVLSFSSNRFLIGELHFGKLSETVIVHGNAPHNRSRFLVSHLIGNRASFLCTKAPMPRVISEWHPISGRDFQAIFCRRRHQPRRPPLAK